jgi:chitin disaccharide deacetylase
VDTVIVADDVPVERWMQFYLDAVKNLKPGLSEILFHLGSDDAELRAVTVGHEAYGAAWRQRDHDLVSSAEGKQELKDSGVVLVTWRDIQQAMYGVTP